jgi:hypothetical protein
MKRTPRLNLIDCESARNDLLAAQKTAAAQRLDAFKFRGKLWKWVWKTEEFAEGFTRMYRELEEVKR